METIYKCSIDIKDIDRFESVRQCKWRCNKRRALTTLHRRRASKAPESDDKSFYDKFVTVTNHVLSSSCYISELILCVPSWQSCECCGVCVFGQCLWICDHFSRLWAPQTAASGDYGQDSLVPREGTGMLTFTPLSACFYPMLRFLKTHLWIELETLKIRVKFGGFSY